MSAALQLPMVWEAVDSERVIQESQRRWGQRPAERIAIKQPAKAAAAGPVVSMAFYRRHTEKTLRRYLYCSMQVGRSPAILGDPVGRGWASSRPMKTFEDAVIFVLDVETCLKHLGSLDRQLLCRIVIQEYTQTETASLMGMSVRTVAYKLPMAIDRLTEKLLKAGLLVLPD
jgi:Sigma-70, region 4